MRFRHSAEIWSDHPALAAGVVFATGITGPARDTKDTKDTGRAGGAEGTADAAGNVPVGHRIAEFDAVAAARLATGPETGFPEIQAWRRTFSAMGLEPTRYRCAAEALLRRFRRGQDPPPLHPLVDLCNAISRAFAIPVAVFDVAGISGNLEVRHASGEEEYLTFSGETERPAPHEVIFADTAGRAHARRWTNRQSGLSAVRDTTGEVLVVAEAVHATAAEDVLRLTAVVADELKALWAATPETALLSASSPYFDVPVGEAASRGAGPSARRRGAGGEDTRDGPCPYRP
ncbi:hypothetical protein GCM10017673_55090 [Streptosporangium violaceochromogenes]|nr:hypothetical protein GCM10017673_55090 [Streptosporangium violaceochromogenes]